MPKVSVIIPTYNNANYICEAIGSVLEQTFIEYEIIVVDDGSTDDTQEVLKENVKRNAIKYFYQKNSGVSSARNLGISKARGEYIAFLDADDFFMPTKLEKQVDYLDTHPEAGLVHSSFRKFDNTGHDLGYRDTTMYTGYIYPTLLMWWSTLMATPCVLTRKKILDEVGGFDTTMTMGEDLDLFRKIAREHIFYCIPESLTKVRVREGSASFDKRYAAQHFEYYIEKAAAEDPSLDPRFISRSKAKMFAKMGHNLLGEGSRQDMKLVRRYSIRSVQQRPFQIGAYLGYGVSLLPHVVRGKMIRLWRSYTFRLPKEGT